MTESRDAADRIRSLVNRVDGIEATIKNRGDGEAVPLYNLRDRMVLEDTVDRLENYVAPGEVVWEFNHNDSDGSTNYSPSYIGPDAGAVYHGYFGAVSHALSDGTQLDSVGAGGGTVGMAYDGDRDNLAVYADTGGLTIYDVSDPSNFSSIINISIANDYCTFDHNTGEVWAGTEGALTRYDLSGNQTESISVPETAPTYQLEYDAQTSTLVAFDMDDLKLFAYDDTGSQKWSTSNVTNGGGNIAANYGTVIARENKTVRAYNADTGTVKWSKTFSINGGAEMGASVSRVDGLVAVSIAEEFNKGGWIQFYDNAGNDVGRIDPPEENIRDTKIVETNSTRYVWAIVTYNIGTDERLWRIP